MNQRIFLPAFLSLSACFPDGDPQQVIQGETQRVVDSFDDFESFGLELGPAIAVSAKTFGDTLPTPEALIAGISGLLEMLNPCLDGAETGNVLTITWGIRGPCVVGGIEHGVATLTTTITGDGPSFEVVDSAPLLLNGTSFAETMTMDIDPRTKTATISRSIAAFRGAASDADLLAIDETGTAVLDNTKLPFMTYDLERNVSFNGDARDQLLTGVIFDVKQRLPRAGAIHVNGIEEGALDLVFAPDGTIAATLAKGGAVVNASFTIANDTVVALP